MRRNRSLRARRKHLFERLEARCLLAANIHVVDAYLAADSLANSNPVPSPVVGTLVYAHVDFTTVGLPANANYVISQTVQGVPYAFSANWGAGNPGTDTWYATYPVTIMRGGTSTLAATVDSTNTVAESDETDNTATFQFTPVQEQLQAKLAQPLGAVAERNYGYVNYVDEDPTSPGFADYRGGDYTYDGHDGIDMSVPSFAAMDAGTPVIAAEAGTVVNENEGDTDRNLNGGDVGNYIEIDSGNGYQEYYYHLREGSVGVQLNQVVQQGQVIGLLGSSGNAFGPHLHFGVYNGGPVETYQAPNSDWQNPVPYEGDVDFVEDAGIANYDPGNSTIYSPSYMFNSDERLTDDLNLKQSSTPENIYPWFIDFTSAGESASITTYDPTGAVLAAVPFTTGENFGGPDFVFNTLPAIPMLGTYQVVMTVNGVELGRKSFVISTTGVAEAQVAQGTTFIADNRTTPIDGGTYTQGATATALAFTIRNVGDASMTLGSLTLPMGWTTTDSLKSPLVAGDSETLHVKVDTSVVGYRYGFLSFTTGDPNQPTYKFALEGTVNPTGSTPAVSIYTRDAAASETGRQPGVVRVQRTGDTSNPLTVNLTFSGTAVIGSDYTSISPPTVTIPVGASAASVIITPIDDATAESTETAIVSLAAGSGYTSGIQTSATINIADNDTTVANTKISGQIYLDKNFNTYQDSGETGVAGIHVFLDSNSNGTFDAGEMQATTDSSGNYTFSPLAPGRYNVRLDSTAYVNSTPVGSYTTTSGQTLTVNLGAFPIAFTGTSGADTFGVAAAATPNRELITAGGITYNAIRSQIPSLSFNGATGSDGNDALTLDASVLGLPPGLITTTPITYAGGLGTDSLTIANTNSSQDLSVQSGQLTIASNTVALSTNESIVLDGSAGSAIPLHSLSIASTTVTLPAEKNLVLMPATLSITGTGKLDLADEDMIVSGGMLGTLSGSTYSGILGLLQTGRSGNWTGLGIDTSSAGSSGRFALGATIAGTILPISGSQTALWDSQTVTSGAVLVKYTYSADANLSGKVDGDDYFRIDSGFGAPATGFLKGDFDYNGKVNADDYFLIDSIYGKTPVVLSLPLHPAGAELPQGQPIGISTNSSDYDSFWDDFQVI